jgi:uncharacterized membrane protein HdeD (DUF308 family)
MEQAAVVAIGLDPATSREIKRHSGWFIALGVALIVLGVIALGAVGLVTLASVVLFGWLLVFGGIMHGVHAFRVHPWGGFTRHLLGGVLSLVVGLLMVANPAAGALSLTLLLAAFFMVGGIFRIVAAVSFRFPGRGWAVFGGLVTLVLGAMIWSEWPTSSIWVIGTFVGIDLIFDGWSLVMTGMAARQLPA